MRRFPGGPEGISVLLGVLGPDLRHVYRANARRAAKAAKFDDINAAGFSGPDLHF